MIFRLLTKPIIQGEELMGHLVTVGLTLILECVSLVMNSKLHADILPLKSKMLFV